LKESVQAKKMFHTRHRVNVFRYCKE
jgi:hypothetical protein